MSACTIIYDHLEADPWAINNSSQVNPIPFDYMAPGVVASGPMKGALIFTGSYSKNLAGGLLSQDIPLPVIAGKKLLYTALNVKQYVPVYPNPVMGRNEMDLKWTLVSGSAAPVANQANISSQINADSGQWQLDPTGKAWVDTGYIVKNNPPGQNNVYQIRASSDGATAWSVTGLKSNNDPAFIPGSAFQNILFVVTNWTAGLHGQLQWEGLNPPFSATIYYLRVQVMISDSPIPMLDPATF